VALAEGGDRRSALAIMRRDAATLAIVEDSRSIKPTIRRAATMAAPGRGVLVIWAGENVPFQSVRKAASQSCGSRLGWSVESVPEEQGDVVTRRLWSRPLRAVVMDRKAEQDWVGHLVAARASSVPVVVVDSTESAGTPTAGTAT
jgi:hypothetical protein